MKKSTKGALAAGTAAVLLAGGAGTLAFWTDEATVNGGQINTGEMTLSAGTCDANWVYAPGNAQAGVAIGTIVPGDSITKECTFTITADGDNLSAELDAPNTVTYTETPTATTDQLDVTTAFELNGTTVADGDLIDENDDGTLTATFTVAFPFGNATTINANDTQKLAVALNALTVTLTQQET